MRRMRFLWMRRLFLWLALGPRTYAYMRDSLAHDPRLRTCRMADIVIRKDGFERRIEADWLKKLGTILLGRWRPKNPLPSRTIEPLLNGDEKAAPEGR